MSIAMQQNPTDVGFLRIISPVEDRIDEAIEKMNTLKRMARRPHDKEGMKTAAMFFHNDVEDALDRVSDALDDAVED